MIVSAFTTVSPLLAVAAGGVFVFDVLTKILAQHVLPARGVILAPGLALRLFENTHGPFGVLPLWATVIVSVGVLLVWLRFVALRRNQPLDKVSALGLGLLIGGGGANILERIVFQRTTDMLWLGERTALNVADVAILTALVLLLGRALRSARA